MTDNENTLLKRRESLDAAISAIENGAQSYTIGNITVTKATLSTLYRQRGENEKEIRRSAGEDIFLAAFAGR